MALKINTTKIISALIIVLPILNIYKFKNFPVGYGDAAVLVIIVLSLYSKSHGSKWKSSYYFISYFVVFFMISLIFIVIRNQNDITDFLQKLLKISAFAYVIDVISQNNCDYKVMRKWIVRIGTFVSVLLIVQVIMNIVFSKSIYPYIPFLNLNGVVYDDLITTQMRWNTLGAWRCSSIFTEPAHFAQYTLLPLTVCIFGTRDLLHDKKNLFCAGAITLALLLSRSANGIILLFMVWGIYAISLFKSRIKVKYLIGALIVGIVGSIIFFQTDFFSEAWGRVETITVRSGGTTGNLRVLQGFAVFSQLPELVKWFGVGFGNVNAFLVENQITTTYLSELGNEYMNGFSTVLVSGGIIGFILYLLIWFRLFFENKDLVSRMAFFVISILFCTSAMFYSCATVMYLVFVRCKKESPIESKGDYAIYRL